MAEKTLTKAEWALVEKQLSGFYGSVYLLVDGRRVTFARRLVSKNRLSIVTYVDDCLEGKWMLPKNECPESSYLRRVERFVYSAKERALEHKTIKRIGVKTLKKWKLYRDPNKKFLLYDWCWPSVTAIRRHYEKTFKSIELRPADGQ